MKKTTAIAPIKLGDMMTATVAVIKRGKIYLADFPVNYRVLHGFFYEGDNTLVLAAKALFGISPTEETHDFVHADYVIDLRSGDLKSAKTSRETFVRRVKEEARHLEIIHMLMEEV